MGESLLPSLLPILDALGVRDTIEAHGFVRETGAFYGWGGQEWSLCFDEPGRPAAYSFQVIRSEFDELLLRQARHQGVDVREIATVRRTALEDGRPVAALWSDQDGRQGHTEFDHLLGRTRAAALAALRHPATTSGTADRVGVSLPSASQHTAVLRNAGLITTTRTGTAVLHTLTPPGAALLHGDTAG